MLTLGFGGINGLTIEQEEYVREQIELKLHKILEENGWNSSYGQDPLVIIIQWEELFEKGELDEFYERFLNKR